MTTATTTIAISKLFSGNGDAGEAGVVRKRLPGEDCVGDIDVGLC